MPLYGAPSERIGGRLVFSSDSILIAGCFMQGADSKIVLVTGAGGFVGKTVSFSS